MIINRDQFLLTNKILMKVIDNNAKISMKNMKKSEETYNDSDVVCKNW